MSALQYLNKKSWHTATIKNNEKKWLREQEAAKEKARIEELQKQLAEERRQEQLQRLEEESGRVDPNASLKRQRLNWMYEYGRDENENEKQRVAKEREDILLGKKAVNVETAGETERAVRANLVDMEAKMREDPLVQIEIQRAKLRGLAGISDATTTTQNPAGLSKLRLPIKAESEQLAKEKAQRRDERRRIRELRQSRREKRVLQRHRASFGVSDGSRAEIHALLKNTMDDKGLHADGLEASTSRERGEQQSGDHSVREDRFTRNEEMFESQKHIPKDDSRERRSLQARATGKWENLYGQQRGHADNRDRLHRVNYCDSSGDDHYSRKRYRGESDDGIYNRNMGQPRDKNLTVHPQDKESCGDFRKPSRWDLRS